VIVLDDADLSNVAEQVFKTAFANNGQTCIAPKRVYVAESLKPALVEALAERARTIRVGAGTDPDTARSSAGRPQPARRWASSHCPGRTVSASASRPAG
jgi:acyl-CoA reductase-like NAD-dependent aldehyde dehydrogenase